MPSKALATAEDKNKVRRALPDSKIYAATVARLYVAYPNPQKWAYSGIWGAVVFLKDKKNRSLYFKIVDLMHPRDILWEQELYDGFELTMATPFFFTFPGDEYMIGLSFSDTTDASVFYTKVMGRESLQPAKKAPAKKKKGNERQKERGRAKRRFGFGSAEVRATVSHLGHIGYTPEKGFSVQNNDPEWDGLFDQLKELGISAERLHENEDFIKSFVKSRGGPPPPPVRQHTSRAPPPPPPPARRATLPPPVGGRRPPPPPPPSRRG
ncbi:hypothetical protein BX666DRAFT_2154070, partial [Dichotomocladium elegans]